mgnify:CR=1 FL=1
MIIKDSIMKNKCDHITGVAPDLREDGSIFMEYIRYSWGDPMQFQYCPACGEELNGRKDKKDTR